MPTGSAIQVPGTLEPGLLEPQSLVCQEKLPHTAELRSQQCWSVRTTEPSPIQHCPVAALPLPLTGAITPSNGAPESQWLFSGT